MAIVPTRVLAAALSVAALAACSPDAATAPVVPESPAVAVAPTTADARRARLVFSDDFSSYGASGCLADGATFGSWLAQFDGYGCTETASDASSAWVSLAPMASTAPDETHAALVLGPSYPGAMTYGLSLVTDRQLRTNGAPNPWEVAWAVWSYTDDAHFYYFILKPNGWELGKRDPAYPGGQRFLATGGTPAYAIGQWNRVEIAQSEKNGTTISVSVDGRQIVTFTDRERPYGAGRIGVYSEDAAVRATNVTVAR